MEKFYFVSIENQLYAEPHRCKVLGANQAGWLKVELSPPIPRHAYDFLRSDLTTGYLAPRYVGQTLTPEFSEWPTVANLVVPGHGGSWETGPWALLDIVRLSSDGTAAPQPGETLLVRNVIPFERVS